MKQPIVPSDLLRVVTVSDPQITPDGRTVLFRRTSFDVAGDTSGGNIWRARIGADAEPFTTGSNDRMARVDPAGERLAFVRDLDDAARIHIMPLDGGEAVAIGEACKGISSLVWSPDGGRLAYTAPAPFDAATANVYLDESSGARHIRALPYKTDPDGLLDGRRAQLFVLDLATGDTVTLTAGNADAGIPAWAPDGRSIVYTIAAAAENTMVSDIAIIDVATQTCTRVTAGDGPNGVATFSPDGMRLAWLGHRHGNDTRFGAELFVANIDGTARRSLSAALDRSVANTIGGDLRSGGTIVPRWSDNGTIIAAVSDGGATELRSFAVDGDDITIIAGGDREIYAFAIAPNGTIALAYSTPIVPSELALLDAAGEHRLSDCNPWLADKHVIEPQHLAVTAADGTAIDAWLIAPETPPTPSPLALEIHGGPHATYGSTFFFEFQLLANCGIGVVYGNPRGSQAYGQQFASAITGDWGGIDAGDLHAILDAALARGSFDAARVAAVGGSYGGFMTTWLLGHSDRFAAGISMRACNDFVSFTGNTDIGFFLEAEFGLAITTAGARELFERSPMRAAEHITAPLLVMHSERDFRCPIDQGEQLFNVLRMLGKSTTEFVRFTGDGHELSRGGKPRHRVLRLRAIAHWLRRHLGAVERTEGDDVAGSLFRPLPGEPELDG